MGGWLENRSGSLLAQSAQVAELEEEKKQRRNGKCANYDPGVKFINARRGKVEEGGWWKKQGSYRESINKRDHLHPIRICTSWQSLLCYSSTASCAVSSPGIPRNISWTGRSRERRKSSQFPHKMQFTSQLIKYSIRALKDPPHHQSITITPGKTESNLESGKSIVADPL